MDHCIYDRLQDPLVRDLAWVAWSLPLLQTGTLPIRDPLAGSIWRTEPDRLWQTLLLLESDSSARAALLPPTSDFRLGTYFERLWHALLELAPDVTILARNLRLQQAGITRGEVDLLLEGPAGEVVHLELAIKFYLGVPALCSANAGPSPASAWLGPDPRDSLASKLERLRSHQLPLIEHIDLAAAGLPRPDHSCAWLQGQLFFPLGQPLSAPTDHQPGSGAHRWCGFGQWQEQAPAKGDEWVPLAHKRWLMPPSPAKSDSDDESPADAPRRARILIHRDEVRAQPLSARRVMLVADDWPLG